MMRLSGRAMFILQIFINGNVLYISNSETTIIFMEHYCLFTCQGEVELRLGGGVVLIAADVDAIKRAPAN